MTHDLKNLWERHGQAKPPSRHTLRQLAEVKIIDRYDERVLLLWLSRVASSNHCNNNNTIIEEKDMLVFFACRFVQEYCMHVLPNIKISFGRTCALLERGRERRVSTWREASQQANQTTF
jgi:hypothetical protein